MKDKINNLQIIRGGATLLVVLGHITTIAGQNPLVETIYYFHMPLFFIISGFLFGYKEIDRILENGASYQIGFMIKKLVSLGIPYLLFSSVYIVLNSILNKVVSTNSTASLSNILSLPWKPVAHYWFLLVLIIFFLVIGFICRQRKCYEILIFLFVVGTITSIVVQPTKSDLIMKMCKNAPYFIGGILLGYKYNYIIGIIKKYWIHFTVISTAMFFILTQVLSNVSFLVAQVCLVSMAYCGSIAFSGIIVWLSNRCSGINNIFTEIGNKSWYIFLIHSYFTAFVRAVMGKIFPTTGCLPIELIAGTVVPICAGLFVAYVCQKVQFFNYFFYPQIAVNKYKIGQRLP